MSSRPGDVDAAPVPPEDASQTIDAPVDVGAGADRAADLATGVDVDDAPSLLSLEDPTKTANTMLAILAPLPVGTKLGRYVLLELLDRGGTAIVYKAYDPDLHREVAVKVLRFDRNDRDRAPERLLREAQALARLSHPNVIAVYDVGMFGEDIFLAMELVTGPTLREWLRSKPRSVREILEVMQAAGRGLVAAHAVGLIHRDFKPANVMLGSDGRVRVLDFGLARRGGLDGPTPRQRETTAETAPVAAAIPAYETISESTDSLLDRELTRVGALAGTPAYMAPEQFSAAADERSDQFAFAVSLYEALYRARPYIHERSAPSEKPWRLATPPAGPHVPGWLRAVVMRGIELEPARRYPSVQAMLDALARDPWVWRRRAAVAAGAAAVVAIGALAIGRGGAAPAVCQLRGDELSGAWDASRREATQRAFAGSGHPLAADRFTRYAGAVDAYAAQWREMRTDACRATRVVGGQSEALLDLRMTCLDRLRGRLAAVTSLYASEADRDMVDGAPDAAFRLGDLASCADAEALLAVAPPPRDPAQRALTDDLRKRLDAAAALQQAGRYPAAFEQVKVLATEVERSGDVRLRAQTQYRLGDLGSDMADNATATSALYEAARLAAEAHDDDLVADSWLTLAWVIGYQEARVDDGMTMLKVAEAAVARAGSDDRLRLVLIHRRVGLLHQLGDFARARADAEEAVQLAEAVYGPHNPRVADSLVAFGAGLYETRELPAARAALERAISIYEESLGADHPRVNYGLENLGLVLQEQGDKAGAAALFERSAKILERAYGPTHPDIAHALTNLGSALVELGRPAEAEVQLRRALTLDEAAFGSEHPDTADALFQLGRAAAARGDKALAIRLHQRALAIRVKVLDPKHPHLTDSRTALKELGALP